MFSSRRAVTAGALAFLGVVAGCGYTMVGANRASPATMVAVPLFENRTFEPLLDARVTERLKSRLAATSPFQVVNRPGVADVVIHGAITAFGVTALSFDSAHRALEQRVSITVSVTTTPRGSTALPAVSGVFTGTAEYTETDNSLQTRAAKNRAIEEAGDALAQDLVARLVSADLPSAGNSGDPTPSRVP